MYILVGVMPPLLPLVHYTLLVRLVIYSYIYTNHNTLEDSLYPFGKLLGSIGVANQCLP